MTEAEFALRLIAGLLLGSVIGFERQWRQRTAGLRTNALVSVGATLFVALSIAMDEDVSPTRVAAQVVSGIGFLGAGVIIHEGISLRGIDTAATLWCAAAIGSLAGAGLVLMALGGTLVVIFANVILRPFARYIEHPSGVEASRYRVRCQCPPGEETRVRALVVQTVDDEESLQLQGVSTRPRRGGEVAEVRADILGRNDQQIEDAVNRLSLDPDVSSVSWERLPNEDDERQRGHPLLGRGR